MKFKISQRDPFGANSKFKIILVSLFFVFALQFSIVNFQLLTTPQADAQTPHRIICLGDSITVGYGPRFRTPASETCTVNAEVGRQTAAMVTEFTNNIRGRGYTDIIIAGGRNDFYSGRTTQQIQNNLSTIYRGAKADGMRVIAMTILPSKTYRSYRAELQPQFEALNRWIMSNADIDIKIDTYTLLGNPSDPQATNPRYLAADSLHPNAEGYELIVRTLSERAFGGPPGDAPRGPAITQTTTPTQVIYSGAPVPLEAPFGSTATVSGTGGYIVNYSRIIFAFAGGIAGGLAMIMLIVAGIQIMTSSGEEQITQAKARIMGALLGLTLLSTGGLLLYLINPCFFSFEDAQVCTTRIASTGVSTAPNYTSTGPAPMVDTSRLAGEIPVTPGAVIWPDGSRHQLTREDVLWMGRMLEYEGSAGQEQHAAELLWIVVQRWYWMPALRSQSFTEVMRSFSQPINPLWARNGPRCYAGSSWMSTSHCSEAALRRRDQAVNRTWESLNSISKRVAEAFSTGQLTNPAVGIVDFASQARGADGVLRQIGCNSPSLIFVRNAYPPEGDCQTPGKEHLFAGRRGTIDSLHSNLESMRVAPAT